MKIIFMGTPDFACGILESIIFSNKHKVAAVVTIADKPAGRGMQLIQSPVKKMALKYQLPLLQPEKLKDINFIEQLSSFQAELFVVVAFRMLPKIIWDMPPKGSINLHASLLPQYRGAAPINWAIINGETITGVTTFFINDKIDEGNLILTHQTFINEEDNFETLHNKLLTIGKKITLETLDLIENNKFTETKQPNLLNLKKAPKIFKEDCQINWQQSAYQIHNFIRGLSPYPTAFTYFDDDKGVKTMFKIFESQPIIEKHQQEIGVIETDNKNYLRISCQDGYIYVEKIQLIGKKQLLIRDFLLGNKKMHFKKCF